VCAQAFRAGPHIGVQFHPEVTPAIALDWGTSYPASVAEGGTTLDAVRAGGEAHAAGARVRAYRLFDAFLASARAVSGMRADALG
jgi:hypothetical protein